MLATVFVPATLCLLAAAVIGTLALGVRGLADRIAVTLCLSLLAVSWLVKALLVAGAFTKVGAALGAGAVLAATVGLVWWSPTLRTRVTGIRLRRPARAARDAGRPRDPFRLPAFVLLAITGLVYLRSLVIALWLPPRDIDTLWYHLVAVAGWVRTGGMDAPIEGLSKAGDLDWVVVSDTYPRDTETVTAWLSVFTHNSDLVGLTQYPFLVLMFVSTYGICRRLGTGRGLALSAASVAVLAPTVVSQSYMAYNDIARAGVAVAVWHLLLIAYPQRGISAGGPSPKAMLVLTGAVLGLGLGVKAGNGYLIPFAVLSALVLRYTAKRGRAAEAGAAGTPESSETAGAPAAGDDKSPGWKFASAALIVPAAVLGSFWYLITWARWGSPFWPIKMGPFEGPETMDFLVESARPREWQGDSMPVVVWKSWWSAIDWVGDRHWYVEWTGQLGLTWLLVLLPSVVVLAVLAAWRRRHLAAAFGVVLPLMAGTLMGPGAWYSRYTMPLMAAGAVAFAVLVQAWLDKPKPRTHRIARRAAPALALAVAVAACVSLTGQFRHPTFSLDEDPHQRNAASTNKVLTESASVRDLEGIWGPYAKIDELPDGSRIGFCADDSPQQWIPMVLIGRDFRRVLVDLGECGDPAGAARLMAEKNVPYLFTYRDSPMGEGVLAEAGDLGLADLDVVDKSAPQAWMIQLFHATPGAHDFPSSDGS
ncbi:hypothetical protein [Yinghuangia soli]|uniref:Uncharacterized protein n=1 Tax=Yinghuangia soli TaxID=2908204 RepID=A0AA41U473_9ACTN|nr:hypothetical protein [Yinghuangia soli]MCF2533488.1 hypothetical protein [Yinghuangia soli]